VATYRGWVPAQIIQVGDFMEPVGQPTVGFEATAVAGDARTGITEPNWNTVIGGTTTDDQVTWTTRQPTIITWTARDLYKTGATEPSGGTPWSTVLGGTTDNGSIRFTTRTPAITDSKCPNSPIVFAQSSKIFSPQDDVVRYSATNKPRDWSTQDDAGFLPTGLQSPASSEVTNLDEYHARLVVQTESDLQIWTTDPDPAEMSLFDKFPGLGTIYSRASSPSAGDLYFLTKVGVRSLTVAASSSSIAAGGDVGIGIDSLVQAKLAGPDEPIGFYYPGQGQYWLCFGNEAFVLSHSRPGKAGAWSRYVFPFAITDATTLDGDLYLRVEDDYILRVAEGVYLEPSPDAAPPWSEAVFPVTVWFPYLDCGSPGYNKRLMGVDVVGYGEFTISIGYDQLDASDNTYTLPWNPGVQDTLRGGRIPVSVSGPSFAVKLEYPGGHMQLNAVALYLQDNGGGS
jgi:hypothetical protein